MTSPYYLARTGPPLQFFPDFPFRELESSFATPERLALVQGLDPSRGNVKDDPRRNRDQEIQDDVGHGCWTWRGEAPFNPKSPGVAGRFSPQGLRRAFPDIPLSGFRGRRTVPDGA